MLHSIEFIHIFYLDYNECVEDENACDRNASCIKLQEDLTYMCQCREGYFGNGSRCSKGEIPSLLVMLNCFL